MWKNCFKSRPTIKRAIADEGKGFDPCDVPDPTAPENLERPCGRGIMLMRHYMTTVAYNEHGNVVSVEHHREGMQVPVSESEVELTLAMRDQEHCRALIAAMERRGYTVERLN